MRIKSHRKTEYIKTYCVAFDYTDDPNSGFRFDCDENGKVDVEKLTQADAANYTACLTGKVQRHVGLEYTRGPAPDYDYIPVEGSGEIKIVSVDGPRLIESERRHITPAVGICDHCGHDVTLGGFTNTCECGTDYNMSGSMLASRSQWGEETGETVSDILSVDYEDGQVCVDQRLALSR